MDDNTRDIAMMAKTLIDAHMTDCTQFREGLRADFKEFNIALTKLNNRVMMIIGGIVLFTHGIDWLMTLTGHK